MKISLHYVLFALSLVILTPAGILSVQAQDASYPIPETNDSEGERERERIMYSPGEADQIVNTKVHVSVPKDSVSSRPATVRTSKPETPKSSSKPASQDDDSILSFNFLYYLFEKYKMQDIVD